MSGLALFAAFWFLVFGVYSFGWVVWIGLGFSVLFSLLGFGFGFVFSFCWDVALPYWFSVMGFVS